VSDITPLQFFIAVWIFTMGCAIGSFLNVCIWRLPRGMSVTEPQRSLCPKCGHSIAWYDNIPLLSYLILGGRCRHCKAPISWQYPVVEGLTGAVLCALYVRQGIFVGTPAPQLLLMMLVALLLIGASAVDAQLLIIPDEISVFGLVAGLLAGILLPGLHVGAEPYHAFESLTGIAPIDGLLGSLLGAGVSGAIVFFFAVVGELIFRKEALGFGDTKLMAMVGAFFGWKVGLATFFISPFLGLLYGLPLLVLKDEHVMPYGPFLSTAAVLTLVFRDTLTEQLRPIEQVVSLLLQQL
jgi:leader peptidase (prepilin peptidase)/N-methyltransferase